MTDRTSSPPGTNDRYRLQRLLATGGMATVHLADDLALDRPVAFKILSPALAADPSFVDRFRREAQAAGRLRHPNIVTVYDWGPYGDSYYIAMEYVEGRTLAEVVAEEGPLSPARAAHIARQIAEALEAAHQQGLVHRDIKPSNVVVGPSDEIKITDFGIARAMHADIDLTQTGMIVGTASYLSPEQAQGEPVDPRSDLYSLGVVLFEMVAGQRPFTGPSPLLVAAHHASTPAPRLRSLQPDLPQELDDLIDRLLAKQPGDRYQTAGQLIPDLRRIESGVDASPSAAQPGEVDDARTAVMNAPGAHPLPATEVLPESARPDRQPIESREPGQASGSTSRSTPTGLLAVAAAVLVVALVVAILLVANGLGSGSSDSPDTSTTATTDGGATTVAPDTSTGPDAVDVPELIGRSQADAEGALRDRGLVARPESIEVDDAALVGQVVSQDPEPGTTVESGSTVTIRIGVAATTTTTEQPESTTTAAETTSPPPSEPATTAEATTATTSG